MHDLSRIRETVDRPQTWRHVPRNMSTPVTTRALARKTGLSHITVSRALRGKGYVAEATRERVLRAAEELGYRPNPLVAAWMAHRRSEKPASCGATLAFINPFSDLTLWQQTRSFTKFLEGVRARASVLGYGLDEIHLAGSDVDSERLGSILEARGIEGLIIGPVSASVGHLRIQWQRFAAAAQGYSLARPTLSRACNNYAGTLSLALRQLRRLGYRKIGFVMSSIVNARCHKLWEATFLQYQARIEPKYRVPPCLAARWHRQAILDWFKKTRPEAIVTCHTELQKWFAESGVDIPGDVALVHTDLHEDNAEWAGVDQQLEVVGASAVDLVAGQLLNNERGIPQHAKTVLTEGRWVKGRTVRDLQRSAAPMRGSKPIFAVRP